MRKIKIKFFIIMLIIFSFFQILYIYNSKDKESTHNESKSFIDERKKQNKSLTLITKEIGSINGINITEACEIEGRFHVKVKMQGNKDKILEELSQLEGYNISEYNISHTQSDNSLILEMIY